MLRDITGVSLSSCYDAIYYAMVPNEQLPGLIGRAEGNKIRYVPGGSISSTVYPRYEAHELLHTIGFCSGALDEHIFHDAIYGHINWTLTGRYLNAERAAVAAI